MAETTYNYLITDTINDKVNLPDLEDEILASAITIALKDVVASETEIDCIFKDELSAGDKTILDGLIAVHLGEDESFVSPLRVRVQEENDDPKKQTGGHYLGLGLEHTVPSGTGLSSTQYSVPYPIAMMAFEFIPDPSMEGDYVTVKIAPETIVGAIGVAVNPGDSTFTVSSTVLDNVKLGYVIHLDDFSNKDMVGKVIAIDKVNSTITVSGTATNSFLVSSPTYVKMTICMIENLRLHGSTTLELGSAKIGGSYLPAGTTWEIEYSNTTGTAKTFSGVLELLY